MRNIIDLHCDTIMGCLKGEPLLSRNGHINLEKLQDGNCLAQCFALFISTEPDGSRARGRDISPYELYTEMLDAYDREISCNNSIIRPALCSADISKNDKSGYMSSILTVEDGVELDGKLERVDELFRSGVRMLALIWNYENCIGFPNSPDSEKHCLGLKPFGFETVTKMNELGMIVDVSHLSEGGFWDVNRISTKPYVASHSCCRALCTHQRNLTDEQLKALADAGGVVGINFCSYFLRDNEQYTGIEDVVRHMLRMRNICGIDALAWGSDFDGISSKLEFDDYSGFPLLISALEKHFSDDEIRKINNENFMRVFKDNVG